MVLLYNHVFLMTAEVFHGIIVPAAAGFTFRRTIGDLFTLYIKETLCRFGYLILFYPWIIASLLIRTSFYLEGRKLRFEPIVIEIIELLSRCYAWIWNVVFSCYIFKTYFRQMFFFNLPRGFKVMREPMKYFYREKLR